MSSQLSLCALKCAEHGIVREGCDAVTSSYLPVRFAREGPLERRRVVYRQWTTSGHGDILLFHI